MPSGLSNGTNARRLAPILRVSLSSSRSLTPYVGGAIGLVFSLDLGGDTLSDLGPRSQDGFEVLAITCSTTASRTQLFLVLVELLRRRRCTTRCLVSIQIFLFSKMEYNTTKTKFPNSGLQANIVKSAHICRFGGNLRSKSSAWLMSGQLNLAIT